MFVREPLAADGPMFLLALLTFSACNNAADLQQTAEAAQQRADTRIDAVTTDANQEVRDAQAGADVKIAAVDEAFDKMREDYRHATTTALGVLDRKIADLDAKALTANGPDKAHREARLRVIRAQRDTFTQDYDTLELLRGAAWDATKARLEGEWHTLEMSVDEA